VFLPPLFFFFLLWSWVHVRFTHCIEVLAGRVFFPSPPRFIYPPPLERNCALRGASMCIGAEFFLWLGAFLPPCWAEVKGGSLLGSVPLVSFFLTPRSGLSPELCPAGSDPFFSILHFPLRYTCFCFWLIFPPPGFPPRHPVGSALYCILPIFLTAFGPFFWVFLSFLFFHQRLWPTKENFFPFASLSSPPVSQGLQFVSSRRRKTLFYLFFLTPPLDWGSRHDSLPLRLGVATPLLGQH